MADTNAPRTPAPPPIAAQPGAVRPGPSPEDQKEAVVRLGSAKGGWWRQVGWRHLIGVIALFFALFPIVFVISAALNPLGTLSSSQLIPTAPASRTSASSSVARPSSPGSATPC